MTPEGSPIKPVKSPIKNITVCPKSWNALSLFISTVCPKCRSAEVGSNPALTVSFFLDVKSFLKASSGMISSEPLLIISRACLVSLSLICVYDNLDQPYLPIFLI